VRSLGKDRGIQPNVRKTVKGHGLGIVGEQGAATEGRHDN
jgi:hypothetical protein